MRIGLDRARRQSISIDFKRARLMNGLNKKAAIDNILIELKDRLKAINPNEESRRDSHHFTEKEGKEIRKMFQKFKLITT